MKSQAIRAGALGAIMVGIYAAIARRRQLEWGATTEEAGSTLPGDDLVPNADLVATRCISVRATPEQVWPWIAQLGQGRGGFYSYDALENLVGCDIHSADRIVPEFQHPQEGDEVKLHPEISLAVALVQPGPSCCGERSRSAGHRWSRPMTPVGRSSCGTAQTAAPDCSSASATSTRGGGRLR
jgi:hypothetical protein